MTKTTKKQRIEYAARAFDACIDSLGIRAKLQGDGVELFTDLIACVDDLTRSYAKQVYYDMDRSPGGSELATLERIEAALSGSACDPADLLPPIVPSGPVRSYVLVADAHFGQCPLSRVGVVEGAVCALLDDVDDDATVLFLGDTLHSDSYDGRTSKGTPVHPGRRPEEVVPEVVGFVQRLAERRIPLHFVQGNHDRLGTLFLAAAAKASAGMSWVSPDSHVGAWHGDVDLTRIYPSMRSAGLRFDPGEVVLFRGHGHRFDVTVDGRFGTVISIPPATPTSAYARGEGYDEVDPAVVRVDIDHLGRVVGWDTLYTER